MATPPDGEALSEFMRAAEVAALLGVSPRRVYELACERRLPVIRQGRRVLFSRQGIAALHQQAVDEVVSETAVRALDEDVLIRRIESLVERAAIRGVQQALARAFSGVVLTEGPARSSAHFHRIPFNATGAGR